MYDRCCCGCCSLTAGTSIALVIASVEAIFGLFVNSEILLLIREDENFNPAGLVINIDTLDDYDVFHGIVWAALGLNAFWIASAIFAVTGNIYSYHGNLTPFIFFTYLLSTFEFGVSVYFATKFQTAFKESDELFNGSHPTKTMSYLALLCAYSGGGVMILFNLYLSRIVKRRGKEIDHDYSTLILYLFSHMNDCRQMSDGMQQSLLPEAPPSYDSTCPPYLPPQIYQRTNSSSGSSWSLSTEALKAGLSNNVTDINSIRRQISRQEHMAAMMNRNNAGGSQHGIVVTDNLSALPY